VAVDVWSDRIREIVVEIRLVFHMQNNISVLACQLVESDLGLVFFRFVFVLLVTVEPEARVTSRDVACDKDKLVREIPNTCFFQTSDTIELSLIRPSHF
jgi:hypothetical protein